jgi:hypothetical protein
MHLDRHCSTIFIAISELYGLHLQSQNRFQGSYTAIRLYQVCQALIFTCKTKNCDPIPDQNIFLNSEARWSNGMKQLPFFSGRHFGKQKAWFVHRTYSQDYHLIEQITPIKIVGLNAYQSHIT